MFKVSIDAGHATTTSGKQTCKLTEDLYIGGKLIRSKGQVIKENEFNTLCAKAFAEALRRHGIEYKFVNDITGKTDTPLSTRASRANAYGSNIHISFHYNATGSCTTWQTKAHGLLVLKTVNRSSKTDKLASCVHAALKGNYDHTYGVGIDKNWSGFTLAILRQTNMPAILLELGFMDYKKEAYKMLDPTWYVKLAEDTCKGVCNYFEITYKAPTQNSNVVDNHVYYRVITGSYLDRANAEEELNKLKGLGYDAFLVAFEKDGKTYLRVVALSTNDRAEADKHVANLKAKGYSAFISVFTK